MKPNISLKAQKFKRNISPVREIMSFADADYLMKIGIDPSQLISFAGGWVNHEAPINLVAAYKDIVLDKLAFHKSGGYSPTLGYKETKEAIIKFEETIYNILNLSPDQILIGQSSTQIALDLFQVLLDPEDKILLLDPSYCNYPTQIHSLFYNINLLRFSVLDNETWKYNAEDKIDEFCNYILQNKPKVVLLIVPDNPTSKVLSDKFFNAALNSVGEIGSFLIIDFAYKEITFTEKNPVYYSAAPNSNYISIHSNSKWGRSLGRRLGWLEGPADVVGAMESIMNSSILCPDSLHQLAFCRFIDISADNGSLINYIENIRHKYKHAAQRTTKAIEKYLKLPYIIPDGGLYTCVKVDKNSALFVDEILKNTGVLFVPGWGFGRSLSEGIRISFGPLVNDLDKIDEGIRRVGEYLERSK